MLIYEQPNFTENNFFKFLFDLKRSEKYKGTLIFFSFIWVMLLMSFLSLSSRTIDWPFIIVFEISFISIFFFFQLVEWRKCYSVSSEEIKLCIDFNSHLIILSEKKISDIKDVFKNSSFSCYDFIFEGAYIKFSLYYNSEKSREGELELILTDQARLRKLLM